MRFNYKVELSFKKKVPNTKVNGKNTYTHIQIFARTKDSFENNDNDDIFALCQTESNSFPLGAHE